MANQPRRIVKKLIDIKNYVSNLNVKQLQYILDISVYLFYLDLSSCNLDVER